MVPGLIKQAAQPVEQPMSEMSACLANLCQVGLVVKGISERGVNIQNGVRKLKSRIEDLEKKCTCRHR